MNYNFDEIIDRRNTASVKYDLRGAYFGNENVIPMWVADMDFKTPSFVIDALRKRLEHEIMGYTFRPDSYYEAIIQWMKQRHNWAIQKDWISFSPGVVPALNMAVLAFTNPGDKIIVQQPVYFPFFSAIKNHNRTLVNNPLVIKNGRYYMDYDDLQMKIDSGAKMLILCNPHNPTGNAWTKEELQKLAGICMEKNILILSDEIHSDLVFEGNVHTPTASLSENISNNVITFMAPSKTFNLAGLSTSVVIGSNKKLLSKFNTVLENVHVGSGNIFGQVALEAAYTNGARWLDELMDYLKGNVEFLIQYLEKHIPQIKPVIPEATYMAWLDCRALGMNKDELKKFMIHEAGVGFSDGTLFGEEGEGFQRINLGCPRAVLKEALDKLYSITKRK